MKILNRCQFKVGEIVKAGWCKYEVLAIRYGKALGEQEYGIVMDVRVVPYGYFYSNQSVKYFRKLDQ